MGLTLRLGTRKGLFVFEKAPKGDWRVKETAFLGDPVTMLYKDARNGDVYAALNLGHFGVKMHRRDGDRNSWREIGVPMYPKAGDGEKGASLKLIWELAASSQEDGPLWAGTIPGGLFRSDDRGESWSLVRSLWDRKERGDWFGGGYDEPGIHSICLDPRNSNRFLVAVSCGGVWETCDAGQHWRLLGDGLRAEYMPPERAGDPKIQDPHRMVLCPSEPDTMWIQHHNGIFRSTDGGRSWREITEVAPSVFGFAVVVHPQDGQKAWFVPAKKDQCRIPVNGTLTVTTTSDGGQSFRQLRAGLPEGSAYDLVYRHALDIDGSGDVLAFASTTGNLWISEDGGEHWSQVHGHLPPVNVARFDP